MKKTLYFLLSLIFAHGLMAQPANDDCTGLIDLGTAPICPSPTTYTNLAATESDIGNDNLPFCFNGQPERDVWFSFVADASILNYQITVSGITMSMPQVAIYRGDCELDGLVLLDCAAATVGDNEVSLLLNGLTPGLVYFLRVNDWSTSASPNAGTFELCIQEFIDTEFNIDETGSDLCAGTLYDTGGPDGDYSSNENNIFSICPADPATCIVMNVLNYNFEEGFDQINFYDGPDNGSPLLASISGGANQNSNGGVCYQVVATSGCLSVELTSDQIINFEGFEAEWYCTDNCPTSGALQVEVGPSANDIETALDNEFMDITVTNINCSAGAYGTFAAGDQTNLGLGDGLLLTTGSAAEVANPASFFASTDLNLGGDPELDALNDLFGMGMNTADACFIEMDVVPKTNILAFEYVFGSDEYKDDFSIFSDDLIGIFLAGPGITGIPVLDNQINIAEMPTVPNQVVSIQSVNASNNWEYFRNNLLSQTIAYNGLTSGFLGETKTLLAQNAVTPCETYQVKISIGDTDENDDSGLFINPVLVFQPSVSVNFNTGINYLVEGCTDVESTVVLQIPTAQLMDAVFNIEISGTASEGTDYLLNIPSMVTFPAGETSLSFPLEVIADGLPEGTETISITMTQDFGCGEVVLASQNVNIEDELQVDILPSAETLFVCDGINVANLQATGAASYVWSPSANFNNPTAANVTATIATSQTVTVTGTLGTCSESDEVFLELISPEIEIQVDGPTALCQGEAVNLNAVNNVNDSGLEWSPTLGLSDPGSATTIASPFATTTYTATVTAAAGCQASAEITVQVEPFSFPEMVANDTTICQNSSVMLASAVNNSSTDFQWTPADGLDDPTIAGATATPEETTTYSLMATSPNGTCTGMGEVTVTVLPANVEIVPETLEICLGETVQIEAMTSTGGTGLTWSPTDSLTVEGPSTVSVFPAVSTWYVATLDVGGCTVLDSVLVQVDSLPILDIEAIPAKDSYCEGENISLVSPNYDFLDFINMEFQWEPMTGVISADSLFNLVINATETTSYIRTTTNGACASMDTIEIIVTPVANITITPPNPVFCPGESIPLLATADQPIDTWEWSPTVGLSCTDCPGPLATPPAALTYQVTGEFNGCPSFASVAVEVATQPFALSDQFICLGESATLNTLDVPGASYTWTASDGSNVPDVASPNVAPQTTTTYSVVANFGGCDFEGSVTVSVGQDFTVSIVPVGILCPSDTNTVSLTAEADAPNLKYTWTDADGNVVGQEAFLENTPITGTTTFTVTAEDSANPPCFTHTASITVEVSPDFTLTAEADPTGPVEGGEEVTLTAVSDGNGLSYEWFDPSSFSTEQSVVVSSCESKNYEVTATDANGCAKTSSVFVEVQNSFSILTDSSFVLASDSMDIVRDKVMLTTFFEGEEFQIGVWTVPSSIAGATFTWLLNGDIVSVTNDTISEVLHAPEIDGTEETLFYEVILTNAEGCTATDSIRVQIMENPVQMPNVFTPNGDEYNNTFLPVSQAPVEILDFQIWNRWGQLVYENENGELGWDGMHNGDPAASDVYIYRVVWQIPGGVSGPMVEKGDVTLLR